MEEYRLTNRQKKLAPKSGVFWCGTCDANLVGAGERCGRCRSKQNPRKLKKNSTKHGI